MKPTEPSSNRERIQVWRPSGFSGLEVGMKYSPVELRFLPSPVLDYRFVINGHGVGRVRFGRESHRFNDVRGLVFLQHPGEVFQGVFDGQEGAGGACIGLSESLIAELHGGEKSRRWRFRQMVPNDRDNLMLAVAIRSALRVLKKHTSLLEQQSKLLDLIETAMRSSATRLDATAWSERRSGSEHRAVDAVKRYFGELPGLDHSMHDLARMSGLNPRYLIRVFRRETGLTPHRYLTTLRVRRAKDLLLADWPLSEVAASLGFANQSHFTRVFKAHVLVPPGEFRRLSSRSPISTAR